MLARPIFVALALLTPCLLAQNITTNSSIPACVSLCINAKLQEVANGTLVVGVSATNISGLCSAPVFVTAYETCLTENCGNSTAVATGEQYALQLCAQASTSVASAASSASSVPATALASILSSESSVISSAASAASAAVLSAQNVESTASGSALSSASSAAAAALSSASSVEASASSVASSKEQALASSGSSAVGKASSSLSSATGTSSSSSSASATSKAAAPRLGLSPASAGGALAALLAFVVAV